jgi:hypothetical protein
MTCDWSVCVIPKRKHTGLSDATSSIYPMMSSASFLPYPYLTPLNYYRTFPRYPLDYQNPLLAVIDCPGHTFISFDLTIHFHPHPRL